MLFSIFLHIGPQNPKTTKMKKRTIILIIVSVASLLAVVISLLVEKKEIETFYKNFVDSEDLPGSGGPEGNLKLESDGTDSESQI